MLSFNHYLLISLTPHMSPPLLVSSCIVGGLLPRRSPRDKNTFDKVIQKSSIPLPKVLETKTLRRSNDAKCLSYHQLRFRSSRRGKD
jgi:hypothetical protein